MTALDRELLLRMAQHRLVLGRPIAPRTLLAETARVLERTELRASTLPWRFVR